MADYCVNTDVVRKGRKELEQLKQDYEEYKMKEPPESKKDSGNTHNEFTTISREIKNTWECLFFLVDKTIDFLGEVSEKTDNSDREGAEEIRK